MLYSHKQKQMLFLKVPLWPLSVLKEYRSVLAVQGDTVTDTRWHSYGLSMRTVKGMFRVLAHPGRGRATVSIKDATFFVGICLTLVYMWLDIPLSFYAERRIEGQGSKGLQWLCNEYHGG